MTRLFWLVAVFCAGLLFAPPLVLAQEEEMEMEEEQTEEEMVAAAQEVCPFICAPVFLFMPGFVASNILDPPEVPDAAGDPSGEEADSSTEFLLRFQVVAPTFIPRTSLVVLTQWTPFATAGETPDIDEEEFEQNAPAFVYGLIITLFDSKYFAASFDPLMVYSGAADPEDSAAYTHKFALELALVPKLGAIMNAPEGAFLGGLAAYALLDYVVTGLPDEEDLGFEEFEPDRWVILGGIIIPFAPFAGT
jgi:hypothetical protein